MSKDFDEDALERMIRQAGGDDRPSHEHRDRLRRQALEAFDHAVAADRSAVVPVRILSTWRWIMSRPATRYAVSAAVVAAILVSLWIGFAARQKVAFADFIQPILEAKTATFKITVQPKDQPALVSQVSVSGTRLHSEIPGRLIQTVDFSQGKQLFLHPKGKLATVVEMKNLPRERIPANYLDNFRDMLRRAETDPNVTVEELGEKQIDGQRSIGYQITESVGEVWTLWMNPDLLLPVRVETSSDYSPDTQFSMSDFRFNVDLDESLFSLTPPEGYKVRNVEHDQTPRTEKDFIVALRWASEALDGRFPDSLTDKEYAKILNAAYKKKKNHEDKDTRPRGFTFPYSLPVSAEPHYAGKGVRFGEKDKPIFWYRPADSDKFHVIYADLSVREMDEAPKVPGAETIGVTPKPEQ